MLHVAAAIIRRGNEILICQRGPGGGCGGLWEFPGGKLEPGEEPGAAAARELAEETGYTAAALTKLAEILPTPAYCTERIYVYEAQGLSGAGEQRLDRGEFLDVVPVPLDQAVEMVLSGEISDAKTQVGILLLSAKGR